jgi:hypothetical protein
MNILQSYILSICEVLFIKAMNIWVDASLFGCVVILSLYLTLIFWCS